MGLAGEKGRGSCACATAWTAAQETGREIAPRCGREQTVQEDVCRAEQETQALMIPFLC